MTIFKNKKFLTFVAAAVLTVTSLNLPTVFASSVSEDSLNPEIVTNAIKPTLMKQKFEANQVAQTRVQKLADVKAEQDRLDQVEEAKAKQEAAAKAKAQQEAAAKAKAAAQQKAAAAQQNTQAQAASAQTQAVAQAPAQQVSGVNHGQFKLSFYDPAVLGSNMGYGGVAANLSVFPKGTRLKITLSDGTVWYRVVNDTGTFAYSNPRQLDVAMPNNMIPSAGVLYATVEVV